MPQHLTDASIKRLPLPARDKKITYDAKEMGFGIRVSSTGHRAFVLNYTARDSGRERRYTIGTFPNWSTVAARAEAGRLRRLIESGVDPLGEIAAKRAAPTVADLIARFEHEHLPRLRPSTRKKYREQFGKHVLPFFGPHTKAAEVRFADIDKLHRKVTTSGGPYVANRVLSLVSKLFSLAVRWDVVTANPCKGVERNLENKRKKYLSDDELARLLVALAEHPNRQSVNVIRILLMTGARLGEVLGMRWDQILQTGTWTKPASTTKQKADHVAPLSAPVRQLLSEIRTGQDESEFVFPSERGGHRVDINTNWRAIRKAAGLAGLRIHDLRHSFASQLASGGASLPLIGALLGHSNPTTTHRYAHLFDDPQRAAVERVGATILNAGKNAVAPPPFKRVGATILHAGKNAVAPPPFKRGGG